MATSTYKTFLMQGSGTTTVTYTKLCDITEFPALGGDPEMLDTTTLSDRMRTYIQGVQDVGQGLQFTANYDKTTYGTLSTMSGEKMFAVWFGGTENTSGSPTPTGSDGKFSFKGELSVYVNGAGVNAVRTMSITIAPTTPIDFSAT